MNITKIVKEELEKETGEDVTVMSDNGLYRVYAKDNVNVDFDNVIKNSVSVVSKTLKINMTGDEMTTGGGIQAPKLYKWLTMEDDKVCYVCKQLHGQTITKGGKFHAVDKNGNDLYFAQPPAHPNCRCKMVGL